MKDGADQMGSFFKSFSNSYKTPILCHARKHIPKKNSAGELNDFRPVALSSIIAKYMEIIEVINLLRVWPIAWIPYGLLVGPRETTQHNLCSI